MANSNFFEQVYTLVSQIPSGKVATYRQIAILLGNPRASRTVGWALHQLPEGSPVPWHRVINAQGKISTTTITELPDWQKILLEQEGIRVPNDGRIDLSQYQYQFEAALG
ncbi:MGMT family protein [candidate division KSB1 bacterium]|nr:MGMT family protein [candidate division KSB1 bacterium]